MRRFLLVVLALGAIAPALAAAQGNPPMRGGQGRRGLPPDSMERTRVALERQVQQRLAQVMKNRMGATDAQMTKVMEINASYSARRRALVVEEREVRMALRREMESGDTTRQRQVADLLDRMIAAQRERIGLLEQEQRDLAGVLTPMQRASYFGLEEQLRQRIQELGGAPGRGGRRGLPPGDAAGPGAAGRALRPPG